MPNGLSPGLDEQSEYFDATENPLFRDKQRLEQEDEDSGVDNASQILRESSVSFFQTLCIYFLSIYYRQVRRWIRIEFQKFQSQ